MATPEAEDLGRFVLRHATRKDARRVSTFYQKNWHDNLKRRGEDWARKVTAERDAFVVEHERSRKIVATAALTRWEIQVGGVTQRLYVEAAASRVPGLGGFSPYSLHQLLHAVRSVTAHVQDAELGDGLVYFGAVLNSETAKRSQQNILAAGFRRWTPDSDLASLRASAPQRDLVFFRLPAAAVGNHAALLLRCEPQGNKGILLERSNRESGRNEKLELVLKVEALTYFRDDVVELAQRATRAA